MLCVGDDDREYRDKSIIKRLPAPGAATLDFRKKHAAMRETTAGNSGTGAGMPVRRRPGNCSMLFPEVKGKPQGGGWIVACGRKKLW